MTRITRGVAVIGLGLGLGLSSIGCGGNTKESAPKDGTKPLSPQEMMEKARGGKKDVPKIKSKTGESDKTKEKGQ